MRLIKEGFVTSASLAGGACIGLSAEMLIAVFAGWVAPMWQGGDALFPLFFGAVTLLVGALPANAFVRALFDATGRKYTSLTAIVVGLTMGIFLLPVQTQMAYLVTSLDIWQSVDPMAGVMVLLGLAAIISALLGAAVAGVVSLRNSEPM